MFLFLNHLLKLFPRSEMTEGLKNVKALNQITKLLCQEERINLHSPWQCMKKYLFDSLHPCYLCKFGCQGSKDFLSEK